MPRDDDHKTTSHRGFASMDHAKQREIASKGGQSVPPEKRSFSQNPGLAAEAGRKGGESVPPEGRSFSQNRELAAKAGRKGGQARGASSQRAKAEAGQTAQGGASRNVAGDNQGELAPNHGSGKHAPAEDSDEFEQQSEDLERRSGFGSQDIEQGDLGQDPGRNVRGGKEHPYPR